MGIKSDNKKFKRYAIECWDAGHRNKTEIARMVKTHFKLDSTEERIRNIVRSALRSKEPTEDDNNQETTTDTNQYITSDKMSAMDASGRLMSIEEYCKYYGLDLADVKSWKLVTHTGIPYYNIASQSVGNGIESLDKETFITSVVDIVSNYSPKYLNFIRKPDNDSHLLIIDCADIHIGKLAVAYETGEDYNTDIAKQRVRDGFASILDKAKNFNIGKILIPIGNDVLHTDNAISTTTSGTFQDTDSALHTMFNNALEIYVEIIDSVICDYDVEVMFNPSNHDFMSGWMLARTLDAWYRNSSNVTIQSDMRHRKYFKYGSNMIGLSHGDGAKMADMPLLMANEEPKMWGETKYRYIYLHHIHHKQVEKFQSGKDYVGVTVEYLRSPSAADRWHATNGYTGCKKAIEGFIHHPEHGQVARLSHYF